MNNAGLWPDLMPSNGQTWIGSLYLFRTGNQLQGTGRGTGKLLCEESHIALYAQLGQRVAEAADYLKSLWVVIANLRTNQGWVEGRLKKKNTNLRKRQLDVESRREHERSGIWTNYK
ncbi:hypothetical protein PPTG_24602 [Phytophthora nicotianae INRA-310]|uniref:Uncharacterized protein n=1 Tax=Phytophthora nicotianae (strain INRA-310) TaxID=761204 RepID=W2PCY2_PHYN3|nr:hypothetical protein PPTG_24602 [Phytophthora nicotianae INRA-310]ETM98515.1 hypothetical protein PPTG_24602 [Phytophthora nicotianae INRA-310]